MSMDPVRASAAPKRASRALLALLGLAALAASPITTAAVTTTSDPYVLPAAAGVQTRAILTVGESVPSEGASSYRLVGIPDGTGAYANGDGTLTWLANHELPATSGAVRDHGATGAFVSRWTLNSTTLDVSYGDDLIEQVATWNVATGAYNAPAQGVLLGRFCSADLPARSAFFNAASGQGYSGRIFMNGEEVGNEGRAFAHLADGAAAGTSYELPRLGKLSFENAVANPATRNKTVVAGTDDSTPGQVYIYVGRKTKTGSPVARAGLTNGVLYGIKVQSAPMEDRATGVGAASKPFSLHPFGDVSAWTGTQLDTASDAAGVTEFLRPEDAHWDPSHPNDLYFVTTDRFDPNKAVNDPATDGRSRLWRARFQNRMDPTAGGTITMLLDGTEPQQMLDNMTIDRSGHVLLQEDPGNQTYLAKIWQYTIATDSLKLIAEHNPAFFLASAGDARFITQDEESSGIIDAERLLGPGWFLFDVQAHRTNPDPELVEYGQLLALYNPDSAP